MSKPHRTPGTLLSPMEVLDRLSHCTIQHQVSRCRMEEDQAQRLQLGIRGLRPALLPRLHNSFNRLTLGHRTLLSLRH